MTLKPSCNCMFSYAKCAVQLGAVLATNEDIAEPDFLQWARAELPAYQVSGFACRSRAAEHHVPSDHTYH